MKSSTKKKTIAGVALVSALTLGGPALIANASTWVYPGSAYCSPSTVYTATSTGWGDTQHRVTGYGGDYYASWTSGGYHEKSWGFNSAWNARVGLLSGSTDVYYGVIGCY